MKKTQHQIDGENLIAAVQELSLKDLRQTLFNIRKRYPTTKSGYLNMRYQSVNAGFGNTGLSALTIACKAYATHYDNMELRAIFRSMVEMLIQNDADPYVQADSRIGECINAITACDGRIPKAVMERIKRRKPNKRQEEVATPTKYTGELGGYDAYSMANPYSYRFDATSAVSVMK